MQTLHLHFVQILPPEAPRPTTLLCRPAGWIARWRKIGAFSVLNRKIRA